MPGGQVDEPQRCHHQQAAGEAHRVVKTEQPAQGFGEKQREPVVERRILEPGFARDARRDPVAGEVHLLHHFDGEDVEGAPGVVPDQPGRDKRQREDDQYGVRGR